MYFLINELDYNDIFDYLSNETYSQVQQKNNHFGQNDQWVSNQIEHIMIVNRPN